MVYLDHNATTPLDARVLESMLPYLGAFYGNPSSLYRLGRVSRNAIETARQQVAALVGAEPGSVIFTAGGTESNNLAIKGLAAHYALGVAAAGATEHPSVQAPFEWLAAAGWQCLTLPVDADGLLDAGPWQQWANTPIRFASVMLANNETGVIQQSLAALGDWLQARNAFIHCDAVQAAGKIPVDFAKLGVHLMTVSSHKIYGPKGAGALIVDKSIPLAPLIEGGGQEHDLRSGTENVPALVGFGKAAELALAELETRQAHCLRLRRQLEAGLAQMPGITVFARAAHRLPNTVQFGMAGMDGETLLMLLDRKGFAVSSGSACASGAGEPSPVLLAMGHAADTAKSAVRVSLGKDNTPDDITALLAALQSLVGLPK